MAARIPVQPPASDAVRGYVASDADRVRSRLMLASLKAMLDRVRGSRRVLAHLSALETVLAKRGIAGLDTIAPKTLAKICAQLASLPLPQDDPALTDLLGRLLDLLDTHPVPGQFLSTFLSDSRLMVSEASQSEFEAAQRGETGPRLQG